MRHIGLSNVTLDQLRAAQRLTPVASVQNAYSRHHRAGEDVLRACEADGIAFLPYRPLDVGRFDPAHRIARSHGADVRQVALAWLLAHSPVALPIPGTADVRHLEQNVAAAALTLTPAQLAKLDG